MDRLSSYSGDTPDVWFDHAFVHTEYHGASIAPVEVLDEPREHYAYSLTMADKMCMSEEQLQKIIGRAPYMKISGRGRYDHSQFATFVISCICSAEPVEATPLLKQRMVPLFSR